jgi:hypothetical protein
LGWGGVVGVRHTRDILTAHFLINLKDTGKRNDTCPT